ncbi:MAG: hypothetical protein IPJ20_01615 [Flammeovirgaceae bacterium]|nr:hypothetical protein [Flammeovirgaceae bacterium]
MLLNLGTVPNYYKNYVKQIDETDLLQALRISGHRALELLHAIPQDKPDFRYAPKNGPYGRCCATCSMSSESSLTALCDLREKIVLPWPRLMKIRTHHRPMPLEEVSKNCC